MFCVNSTKQSFSAGLECYFTGHREIPEILNIYLLFKIIFFCSLNSI